jgi:predicted nucleic acid-binding protein
MKRVFADTYYFLALLNPKDEWHEISLEFTSHLDRSFLTTAWVMTELANSLSRGRNRQLFLELFKELQNDPRVTILPPSAELYHRGLDLYALRLDQDWSLTDCISFEVMQQSDLTEALTADHHFEQAGFSILLK